MGEISKDTIIVYFFTSFRLNSVREAEDLHCAINLSTFAREAKNIDVDAGTACIFCERISILNSVCQIYGFHSSLNSSHMNHELFAK
jgi:hypothetical protein